MSFQLRVCSDNAYENLIAELEFDGGSMVVVSQERGTDRFEVSLYSPQIGSEQLSKVPSLIDLDEFLFAIGEAKVRLKLLDVPPS